LEYSLAEISNNPMIDKAINSLGDLEKKILLLYIIEKYSLTEILKLMDIEYSKLSYILSKIKNVFNLFARYQRKIKYFSYFNDKYDEDLENEFLVTFLQCIRTFNIDCKPNNIGTQKT